VPEYVHGAGRLTVPRRLTPIGYEDIDWEEALELAAGQLSDIRDDDFLMIVSADLSNEDLFAAQAFTRKVMGSANITSEVAEALAGDLMPFLSLALQSAPLEILDGAEVLVTVGLDTTYGFSPIGVAVKKAVTQGGVLAVLGAGDSNLDMYASVAWRADGKRWPGILTAIADELSGGRGKGKARDGKTGRPVPAAEGDWEGFKGLCGPTSRRALIVGPEALSVTGRGEFFAALARLRDVFGWPVIVAHPYANLGGLVAMGCVAGVAPGEMVATASRGTPVILQAGAGGPLAGKRRKAVYLMGEVPSAMVPPCDFLIYQNGFPSLSGRQPDLVLPATVFAESAGTLINAEGRVLHLKQAIDPPGLARSDRMILNGLADRIKKGSLKLPSDEAIRKEMKASIEGFPGPGKRLRFVRPAGGTAGPSRGGPQRIDGSTEPVRHRGIALSTVVAGMKTIEARRLGEALSPKEQS
jgi:NADH dehydrogenase/NADH:ubiquinone oxidoreductase subunit G